MSKFHLAAWPLLAAAVGSCSHLDDLEEPTGQEQTPAVGVGRDAGDAGTDGGSDGGADAGADAGRDGGYDAGHDSGYDAGRDGSIVRPPPATDAGRFEVNSTLSNVVVDRTTNAWWLRQPPIDSTRCGNVDGTSGGVAVRAPLCTWDQAYAYCQNFVLFSGSTAKWRLPTQAELLTLVDNRSVSGPRIDSILFPGTLAARYWTTEGTTTTAFTVNFATGLIETRERSSLSFAMVRCVW